MDFNQLRREIKDLYYTEMLEKFSAHKKSDAGEEIKRQAEITKQINRRQKQVLDFIDNLEEEQKNRLKDFPLEVEKLIKNMNEIFGKGN